MPELNNCSWNYSVGGQMRLRPWFRVQTQKSLSESPGLSRTVSPRFRTSDWRQFHYNFNSLKVHHKMAYYHRVYPFYLVQQKFSKFRNTQISVKFLKIVIKFTLLPNRLREAWQKFYVQFLKILWVMSEYLWKFMINSWQISDNLLKSQKI